MVRQWLILLGVLFEDLSSDNAIGLATGMLQSKTLGTRKSLKASFGLIDLSLLEGRPAPLVDKSPRRFFCQMNQ
jgi:hypothetical protein